MIRKVDSVSFISDFTLFALIVRMGDRTHGLKPNDKTQASFNKIYTLFSCFHIYVIPNSFLFGH